MILRYHILYLVMKYQYLFLAYICLEIKRLKTDPTHRHLNYLLSNTIYSQTLQIHRFNSFWDYFDNKFNGVNLMSKQWENECVKGDQSVLVSMLSGYGYLASDVAEFSCCGSKAERL